MGGWRTPAAQLGEQVRAAVTEQLQTLAGLRVDAVDVTVAKVVLQGEAPRRRVQ